ncbi:LamG-like jellyroll fold domain-containing protein [Nitrosarchaeum koreense]|uniref:Laminin G 2 domain containing protein n=1 Tax=Nitrosarchaeum koreense MY1 TaxID=1001994 RepID=F9CWT0_9ARCH|nr:LamG-like jellyroll fold domain-containing protein [Nitrosarchaeum koreense]EGP93732.1 Laminin G 2 domain containing protein [Nitrosarchaeum koreense MY1]
MKKHRGLSALVGSVFLVAVVISSLSYVTYSMNLLGNFSESLIIEEKRQKDKQNEAFEIESVTINPSNRLDGVVLNTGQVPLEIKSIWIEEDGIPDTTKKFDINTVIAPGDQFDLINGVDYVMDPLKGYKLKLISGRGEVQSFYINAVGDRSLYLNSYTIPETVSTAFDTTILFTVTNNSTNNAPILNLTPSDLDVDTSLCAFTGCSAVKVSGPTPTSYPSLKSGETAIFSWVYTISGNNADQITFEASLANGITSNIATSNVRIKEVESALTSGTALSSLGLDDPPGQNDVLYFHMETNNVPSTTYQLSGTSPEGSGTYLDLDEIDPSFFSNNSTSTVTIPTGTWYVATRTFHENLPDSLMYVSDDNHDNSVDMIFHLDSNTNPLVDSTGNTNGLDKCSGNASPTYVSLGGPDNSPYYSFDGNDCIDSVWDMDNDNCPGPDSDCEDYSDIEDFPDSTALWFRVPTQYADNSRNVIIRWDDNDSSYSNVERYQIHMGDGSTSGNRGKIFFEVDSSGSGSSNVAQCISTNRLDDNTWHHVVAVRNGAKQCDLYIDGVFNDHDNTGGSGNNVDTGGVDTEIHIGYNGASEYFEGHIDQIMHWNDYALTTSPTNQISDLYNARFGDTSSIVDVTIYETDVNGVNIEPPIAVLINQPMKFIDSGDLIDTSDYATDSFYKNFNFTLSAVPESVIDGQNRLNVTLAYKTGLDTIMRIDDSTMTNQKSSFIQFPIPNISFLSFYQYDNDDILQVVAENTGDVGAWFTYQGTRAIFENLSTGNSYAAIVCSANSTLTNDECNTGGSNTWRLDEDRDSIFIDANNIIYLYFFQAQDRPDRNISCNPTCGTIIPAGDYHMYVFISGYDEKGASFLRKIDIGRITVSD